MSAQASGRFVLRIDPGLHAALRDAAEAAGLSLNEYCTRKLTAPGLNVSGPAGPLVVRAASAFGEDLVGALVYGSWARGELRAGSDVDVLLILAKRVALRRALYREWDSSPLIWEGRRVEPQFVHLPKPGTRPTGLWAEAAVDGVILYERGFDVSRWLVAVRGWIAEGHLIRRWHHGQPYWVEAA